MRPFPFVHEVKNVAICIISPLAAKYYAQMKRKSGQSFKRVETTIRTYLDQDRFGSKYANAYNKWLDGERRLWSNDPKAELTTIGHLCREAMQEFADVLVNTYSLQSGFPDKAKTVARLRAVIEQRKQSMPDAEKAFLDALLPYWGTVSDLVQRQEHGALIEGTPLVWEDARRVVFHTAIVMYEIDKALSRFDQTS